MKRTFLTDARITALLYLGLAVTGIFVFMFAKSSLYVPGDALMTTSNLLHKEILARWGIVVELLLVGLQAGTALYFYKTFQKVHSFAAIMLAVFGVINAVMILVSSAMWLGALNSALSGQSPTEVLQLFDLHETIWLVSGLFFGLWLLPMGYLVFKANMTKVLAYLLMIGGIGYILSTFTAILLPDQQFVASILPLPATIAEFWVIGSLLTSSHLNSAKE